MDLAWPCKEKETLLPNLEEELMMEAWHLPSPLFLWLYHCNSKKFFSPGILSPVQLVNLTSVPYSVPIVPHSPLPVVSIQKSLAQRCLPWPQLKFANPHLFTLLKIHLLLSSQQLAPSKLIYLLAIVHLPAVFFTDVCNSAQIILNKYRLIN